MQRLLLDKYRNDRLTPEEVEPLRELVGGLDDETLTRLLDDCDPAEAPAGNDVPDSAVRHIHRQIFEDAGIDDESYDETRYHRMPQWLRPLLWAAAIAIPALIAATAWLYVQNSDYRQMAESDIAVITGEGERVTTVLPDGSKVELNYLSELRYAPASFNDTRRCIRFSGEGYFTVTHNTAAPFTVDADGLQVVVRGTMFNLHVRQNEEIASLYLDEGCVDLRTGHQTVRLIPGQLACVDRATGRIDVTSKSEPQVHTAWRTGFLCFNNLPLHRVIDVLADNYGYSIVIDADSANVAGHFTGHIPSNNIREAVGILEYAYHLRATIDGRTVTLSPR